VRLRLSHALQTGVVAAACMIGASCKKGPPKWGRVTPTPAAPPLAAEDVAERVYQGGLKEGWQDSGWCLRSLKSPSPAELHLARQGGWILAKPGLHWEAAGFLVFRMKPPAGDSDFLEVRVDSLGMATFPRVRIESRYLSGGSDGWYDVRVPISELDPAFVAFDRIILRAFRDMNDAVTLIDDMALARGSPQTSDRLEASQFVTTRNARMTVACSATATKVSPLIYGIAYLPSNDRAASQWTMGATARRWGGNSSSRYNWELSTWNLDGDWFFENKPAERSYLDFLADDDAHGVASALTVPILGWVAKDGASVSFPVSVFGAQGKSDPYLKEAGDGTSQSGAKLTPGSPTRTSVPAPPSFVKQWVEAIRAGDAKAGKRRVHQYILDNEPMAWTNMHRDVRTEPLGYDELLDRTIQYGTAIRQADPEAVIAGPAEWGWTGYFYSGKDGAVGYRQRPDRRAHDDLPLIEWYLRQLRAYEQKTGVRVLDVLDLHFYPQGENVFGNGTGGTDAKTDALRLRSTRALWDPSYIDESWIKEPVRLLPRMKEWVDANYPGRGISIGEWNFGGEGDPTGALASAEALGRFAQFGVTSAFYWTHPPDESPTLLGFGAFRNFDAKGGRFLDWYVPTSTVPGLSLFASRDEGGQHLVAVAINMSSDDAVLASVDTGTCGPVTSFDAYSYIPGRHALTPWTVLPHGDSAIDQVLPPLSITVLDIHLARPMGGSLER
jgi:hypothetical protein